MNLRTRPITDCVRLGLLKIGLSSHACEKLEIIQEYEAVITEEFVKENISHPDKVVRGRGGRLIAQKIRRW
jgi:hypothetical protein